VGDEVRVGSGGRAVVAYADGGPRVSVSAGGRYRVQAQPVRPVRLLAVLGEAARALAAMLGGRTDGLTSPGEAPVVSRGPWAPALPAPPGGRPWPVLPGADPLVWDGDGLRGDAVRLWAGVSEADCSGGTLESEAPAGGTSERPVFSGRAALRPGVSYRLDLVSARGAPRATACVRPVLPDEAEAAERDVRSVERAYAAGRAGPGPDPGRDPGPGADALVAALLAERGFVPDALLRLDRALADGSDNAEALRRVRAAIRARAAVQAQAVPR